MLTTNINIEDWLINGQIGTVQHIEIKENEVRTTYSKLHDKYAGQIAMSGSDIIVNKKYNCSGCPAFKSQRVGYQSNQKLMHHYQH